ncbi:MAG: hypothetical protein Q8N99_08320 [Nanoarchaeota archaeon]|nr:hypothetical protein [Nanoarchaeota archaeon]
MYRNTNKPIVEGRRNSGICLFALVADGLESLDDVDSDCPDCRKSSINECPRYVGSETGDRILQACIEGKIPVMHHKDDYGGMNRVEVHMRELSGDPRLDTCIGRYRNDKDKDSVLDLLDKNL